jgi:CheY-like chemotaxis protein
VKTVLVVDDEEAVVEFIGSVLEDAGYRVLRAYDGRAAYEIARNERPDLIVTDIMMPIMNGLELCRRLRETPETASIPIILVTAGRLPGTECNGMLLLTKPLDLATLEEAVASQIDPENGTADARR